MMMDARSVEVKQDIKGRDMGHSTRLHRESFSTLMQSVNSDNGSNLVRIQETHRLDRVMNQSIDYENPVVEVSIGEEMTLQSEKSESEPGKYEDYVA